MFTRSVTPEDLARLSAAREEADRAYNEALQLIDRSRIQDAVAMPHPPPRFDEHQITPINEQWPILGPKTDKDGAAAIPGLNEGGWKGRLAGFVWRMVGPIFERQQSFNAQLVDHINRNVAHHRELHASIASTIQCLSDQVEALRKFELLLIWYFQKLTVFINANDLETSTLGRRITEDAREIVDILDHRTVGLGGAVSGVSDELLKRWESMLARERRFEGKVSALSAAHEEVRSTLAVVHQTGLTLKRELERLRAASATAAAAPPIGVIPTAAAATSQPASAVTSGPASAHRAVPGGAGSHIATSIDSYKYVGFEDRFRGSQELIRARQIEYLPYFQGASDVLDIGCGRGEFLELLREKGVTGRGLDVNHEMVEVCLARGLNVSEGDALSYLQQQPDSSLGGLIALQVVEHLEPSYLMEMLDVAYHKLRPGSHLILETINVASWYAFFSSYIRDLTHVRPLHPDTLSYLLTASGFQRVSVRYSAPFPQDEKLQPFPSIGGATPGPEADVFNANVDKLNSLLFTNLDYAAIGVRL
jgi:2-polyprenyl-3-methyl-5-hydroxy-6-metoxy-1,4-benzoquinol methylase